MKIVFQLIRESFWEFLFAAIISISAGICSALTIKMIHLGLKGGIDDPQFYLIEFGAYMSGTVILGLVGKYLLTRLTQNNLHNLRISLAKKIMKTSYQKIEHQTDVIIPVLTADINTITNIASKLPNILKSIAIVIGCLGYMAFLSWQLTLFALGLFGLNFLLSYLIIPRIRSYQETIKLHRNIIFKHLRGLVNGLKELNFKGKLRKVYADELISPVILEQNKVKLKLNMVNTTVSSIENLLTMSSLAFAIAFATTNDLFDMTELVQFLALVLFIMPSISSLTGFMKTMNVANIAMDQIKELGVELDEKIKPEAHLLDTSNWNSTKPLITAEGIKHSYSKEDEHENFILGPMDFEINENEVVFVVGGNGSGKTTLVKVLTGLYPTESGRLLYKDQSIGIENMESFQESISAVFSDFHLFQILYHIDEQILNEKSQNYIDYLELSSKVKIVDRQFSTLSLSHGQRKRLGLVAALLENKDIYVFDEWAANQDPFYKSIFYKTILGDLKRSGKTVIVVTHDDTYFSYADRILEIRDGLLVRNEVKNHSTSNLGDP